MLGGLEHRLVWCLLERLEGPSALTTPAHLPFGSFLTAFRPKAASCAETAVAVEESPGRFIVPAWLADPSAGCSRARLLGLPCLLGLGSVCNYSISGLPASLQSLECMQCICELHRIYLQIAKAFVSPNLQACTLGDARRDVMVNS